MIVILVVMAFFFMNISHIIVISTVSQVEPILDGSDFDRPGHMVFAKYNFFFFVKKHLSLDPESPPTSYSIEGKSLKHSDLVSFSPQ